MSAHEPQCPPGSACEDCFRDGYPPSRPSMTQVLAELAECRKGFNLSMDIEGRLTERLERAQAEATKWEARCDTLGAINLDLEWLTDGLRQKVQKLETQVSGFEKADIGVIIKANGILRQQLGLQEKEVQDVKGEPPFNREMLIRIRRALEMGAEGCQQVATLTRVLSDLKRFSGMSKVLLGLIDVFEAHGIGKWQSPKVEE